jgi:hypothetical protein
MAPWPTLQPPEEVRRRYEAALETFVAKVREDHYVIAALLAGSLSHDQVWEHSDMDMVLIGRDERVPMRTYALVEDDIDIHVTLYSRTRFRKELEGTLTGSFFHSFFTKSTLLFTTDESIRAYYDDARALGSSDRGHQLMLAAAMATATIMKCKKWLYVKGDTAYCFLWHMMMINHLAKIETLLADEVPGREVVQQAVRHNPRFFQEIYFDVIDQPKTPETLHALLVAVEQYLVERTGELFQPLLDYLADAGGARTVTAIETHFQNLSPDNLGVVLVCEWLASVGVLDKVAMPVRLTEKSRVTMNEAAYAYFRDDANDGGKA